MSDMIIISLGQHEAPGPRCPECKGGLDPEAVKTCYSVPGIGTVVADEDGPHVRLTTFDEVEAYLDAVEAALHRLCGCQEGDNR